MTLTEANELSAGFKEAQKAYPNLDFKTYLGLVADMRQEMGIPTLREDAQAWMNEQWSGQRRAESRASRPEPPDIGGLRSMLDVDAMPPEVTAEARALIRENLGPEWTPQAERQLLSQMFGERQPEKAEFPPLPDAEVLKQIAGMFLRIAPPLVVTGMSLPAIFLRIALAAGGGGLAGLVTTPEPEGPYDVSRREAAGGGALRDFVIQSVGEAGGMVAKGAIALAAYSARIPKGLIPDLTQSMLRLGRRSVSGRGIALGSSQLAKAIKTTNEKLNKLLARHPGKFDPEIFQGVGDPIIQQARGASAYPEIQAAITGTPGSPAIRAVRAARGRPAVPGTPAVPPTLGSNREYIAAQQGLFPEGLTAQNLKQLERLQRGEGSTALKELLALGKTPLPTSVSIAEGLTSLARSKVAGEAIKKAIPRSRRVQERLSDLFTMRDAERKAAAGTGVLSSPGVLATRASLMGAPIFAVQGLTGSRDPGPAAALTAGSALGGMALFAPSNLARVGLALRRLGAQGPTVMRAAEGLTGQQPFQSLLQKPFSSSWADARAPGAPPFLPIIGTRRRTPDPSVVRSRPGVLGMSTPVRQRQP
jgi:hypothetical protein